MTQTRARDLGLNFSGTPGQYNAITDVPGLKVGYSTINQAPTADKPAKIQTGVTAILPRGHNPGAAYLWAGQHTLNGNGEMTGCHWIQDAGYFVSPICITNTHSVGTVHQATVKWMVDQYPDFFQQQRNFVMPVVAETCDAILNDINGCHVKEEHVFEALNQASDGPIQEGNVGGGNGMITYEFKGGTGTASRQITLGDKTYHLGVLVQSNFGARQDFTVLGVPVGEQLTADTIMAQLQQEEFGSIIVVIATDLPLLPSQLNRVAKRASLGIARTGTIGGHSSGDIFMAFSTANAMNQELVENGIRDLKMLDDEYINEAYRAARDAVEESIINSMVAGETSQAFKPEHLVVKAIDHQALKKVMAAHSPDRGGNNPVESLDENTG